MQVKITGFEKIISVIQRIDSRLSGLDDVAAPVAELVKETARTRIAVTKTAPDGSKWKDVTPRYRSRKERLGKTSGILVFDGSLRDSLRSGTEKTATGVKAWITAGVSTDGGMGKAPSLKYASRQQRERPFLGFGAEEEKVVKSAFESWLRRLV